MSYYNLFGGIAQGIREGLITAQTIKSQQNAQRMAELTAGVTRDENGNYTFTPEMQKMKAAQAAGAQRTLDENDPNSAYSQQLATARGGLMHAADPKINEHLFDGLSAAQQKELEGYGKADITGQMGLLRAQMNPMVAVKQGQLDVAKDNQASSAVDKITKDDQLKSHQQRIQGADRILSQLQEAKAGRIVDTNQFLNDLNTEYVNLLTGANNSALGKQERTEYSTWAGNLASVIQKIKAEPQSINSPEILQQLETSVRSLRDNYAKNAQKRAQQLKRRYAHNPEAEAEQERAIGDIMSSTSQPAPGGGLLGAPDETAAKLKRLQELRAKAGGG